MKLGHIIPLAATVQAVLLPEIFVSKQKALLRDHEPSPDAGSGKKSVWDELSGREYVSSVESFVEDAAGSVRQTLDGAVGAFEKMGHTVGRELGLLLDWKNNHNTARRHGDQDEEDKTIYDLVRESKYTTRFAKLLEEHEDVRQLLEDRGSNYTLFVPTDNAFENIPRHQRPGREFLEEVLRYHVARGYYQSSRVMASHTLPTELDLRDLGHHPQRLRISVGMTGIHVNFYSHVVATNIRAANGIIHAVDRVLVPPPRQGRLVNALPGQFSTFSLAMERTGLEHDLHKRRQRGGTVFAPTNYAFMKLGPRLNAFLFSRQGTRYLRALLKYHVVPDETLYSDAHYEREGDNEDRDRNDDLEFWTARHRPERDHRGGCGKDCGCGDHCNCGRDRDRDERRRRDGDRDRRRDGDRRDRDREDDDDDNDDDDRQDSLRDDRRDRDRDGHSPDCGCGGRHRHGRGGRRHDRDRDRDDEDDDDDEGRRRRLGGHEMRLWDYEADDGDSFRHRLYPGGSYDVQLRSLLGEKNIVVDIRRWMGVISMIINGWVRVTVQDGISQDGVVHVIESILLPPRGDDPDVGNPENDYENDNISVDELKKRLEDYLDSDQIADL